MLVLSLLLFAAVLIVLAAAFARDLLHADDIFEIVDDADMAQSARTLGAQG